MDICKLIKIINTRTHMFLMGTFHGRNDFYTVQQGSSNPALDSHCPADF